MLHPRPEGARLAEVVNAIYIQIVFHNYREVLKMLSELKTAEKTTHS